MERARSAPRRDLPVAGAKVMCAGSERMAVMLGDGMRFVRLSSSVPSRSHTSRRRREGGGGVNRGGGGGGGIGREMLGCGRWG